MRTCWSPRRDKSRSFQLRLLKEILASEEIIRKFENFLNLQKRIQRNHTCLFEKLFVKLLRQKCSPIVENCHENIISMYFSSIVNNFYRLFDFCKQKKKNYSISRCKIFESLNKFRVWCYIWTWNIFKNYLNFRGFNSDITHMGQKMYTCVALTVVALVSTMHFGVEAWGGLFNRFSPEMLSNLGYGSHGDHISKSGLYQVWKKFFDQVFSDVSDIFAHQITGLQLCRSITGVRSIYYFRRIVRFSHTFICRP